MPRDAHCSLWPQQEGPFFASRDLQPIRQSGPHCVSTVLAMLTGEKPEAYQRGEINTQDPASWSAVLHPHGMKLAYCPTDARKLKFYLPELLAHGDLFTLSYYTESSKILRDPDASGWVCSSHIVLLHRGHILDPSGGTRTPAQEHHAMECHTKRIFRVVPAAHGRGL